MGVLSGIITGTIVFFINYEHGFWPAFASFWKQFFFNLFMAGYNTRSCERLAKQNPRSSISLILATVIPTIQAFLILFAIHYFGRTPNVLESTLWQAVVNLIFFYFMALIYQHKITITNTAIQKLTKIFRLRIRFKINRINGFSHDKKPA